MCNQFKKFNVCDLLVEWEIEVNMWETKLNIRISKLEQIQIANDKAN